MKRIKLVLSAVVMLSALAACTNKEEIEGTGHGFDEATFSVEAVSVENTAATFKVSSSGVSGATYYGFLTDDMLSKPEALVKSALSGVNVTRHILSSGTTTPKVEGLRQGGKAYRYIVTGLLSNGATYNTPVTADIVTAGDFVANSAGVISYPNPVSEPTTVVFEGFPGKFVYGYSESEITPEAIKLIVNTDLDNGGIKPAEKEATATFAISEEGTYYVYAYELDENNEPTLSYVTYTLEIENLDFSVYESYLGEWYVNGNEDMKLVITEKQKGVSYELNGIPAVEVVVPDNITKFEPVVLNFDMATGGISLSEQDLSTFTYGNYGTGMKTLSAVFSIGGTLYGYYPFNSGEPTTIFVGAMNEEGNIATVPGICDLSKFSMDPAPVAGFSYSFVFIDGPNAGKGSRSSEIIEFPCTLTKDVAEPSEAYQAWIGTWYTEAGDKMVIAKDKTNATYSVTGIYGDVPVITRFNAADGTMSFYGQAIDKDDTYTYSLRGRDQDNYVESGSQDGTNTLAIATLAADGKSISIVGHEYKAVYSGVEYDEIIVQLEVFAISSDNKIYGVPSALKVQLPATWTSTVPEPTDEFLAWIGNWEIERGSLKDTITIAEKKVNASYVITGIEGTPFEVEAKFDNATGALSVSEQNVYGLVDDDDNNIMTVALYANFVYNGSTYYWGGNAVMFTATLDGEGNGQVEAGYPSAQYIAYYGYFTAFRFYAFIGKRTSPITYSSEATLLPNILKPVTEEAEPASTAAFDVNNWKDTDIKPFNPQSKPSVKKAGKKLQTRGEAPLFTSMKVNF